MRCPTETQSYFLAGERAESIVIYFLSITLISSWVSLTERIGKTIYTSINTCLSRDGSVGTFCPVPVEVWGEGCTDRGDGKELDKLQNKRWDSGILLKVH